MRLLGALIFVLFVFFFFNDTATTEIYTLSLHDALPISDARRLDLHQRHQPVDFRLQRRELHGRSEEHTSELQSQFHLVCRLLLEKKKTSTTTSTSLSMTILNPTIMWQASTQTCTGVWRY